jgi:hypothetical protein
MATQLLTNTIWARLRQLAKRRRRRAWVAVPFVGAGAIDRLPLRDGDVLVTRFDPATIRAGQVDPREIAAYIKRGVEVHAVSNLHAKVFVFGRVAIVGSTNVSGTSEEQLVEAGCQVGGAGLVRACRRFVQGLMGDMVGLEFAKREAARYMPPKRKGGKRSALRPRAVHTGIVAVSLELTNYDSTDSQAADVARREAVARLKNRDEYGVDDFRWSGETPKALRVGSRVLRCTDNGRRIMVEPPARILAVRRYRSGRGGRRAMVVVEVRKYTRGRSLSRVLHALGPVGKPLRGFHGCRPLRDQALVYQLGQLWATVA